MKARGKFVAVSLVIGGVIGAVLGNVLKRLVPVLDMGVKVGFSPVTFDFYLFDFTMGLHLRITVAAVIGMIAALLIVKLR